MKKILLIVALVFPVLALFGLILKNEYQMSHGHEYTLAIAGFDPIDLLTGHYLTYRIDYGEGLDNKSACKNIYENDYYFPKGAQVSCLCFKADKTRQFSPGCKTGDLETCEAVLRGECRYGRFTAGIEKYYIPESQAKTLDMLVRLGKASIVISIQDDGQAVIKNLLIDDKPWQEYTK